MDIMCWKVFILYDGSQTLAFFWGRPWPPVQDGLLADRRSTKKLKEFVLLSSPSTTEEVVQVTWPPKKKSKHSNTEKRFGPLLQDSEYIMTAMEDNLPLVILCDLFFWNGAEKKTEKVSQNGRLDWITFKSQKCFFQASTWNWKGYTEYWGFQVEFVGFGEVDLGTMSQEALCFSSFIGNSRKVSILSSELEELSLALLFKNMGTSTLIVDFPAITGFQDQTSGATTVEANILWENPIPPEKMKGHVTLVTLLTIWWTMTTPLMHIYAVFDFTPRKSNTYTNEGPTVCYGKCDIGRPQVQSHCILNIFFRHDKVYMRLKRANALYADSLEHSPLSSNEAIWMPYISLYNIYVYIYISCLYMKHLKTLL